MRVFWPLDAPRREAPGLIVGWRNSERDIMVVTILHDIDVRVQLWLLVIELTLGRVGRRNAK